MASGDDPLADMQNILGYAGLVGPNPYSPFQNAIPFSGGAGPGVGFIAGMPTQAWSGQPIGSAPQSSGAAQPPGTTLNGMPAGGAPGAVDYSGLGPAGPAVSQIENSYLATPGGQAAANNPNAALINYAQSQNRMIPGMASSQNQGGFGAGNNVMSGDALAQIRGNLGQIQQLQQQGATQSAAQQGGAMGPSGLTRQQHLSMLANPGPLPVYAAQPPQAGQTRTGSAPPDVVQAFLSTQGGKGTPFTNTLNKLQGATS